MINTETKTFTIKKEIVQLLRQLSDKTGLKMSTIIERGILLVQKENQ
jgi:hypothetical protein